MKRYVLSLATTVLALFGCTNGSGETEETDVTPDNEDTSEITEDSNATATTKPIMQSDFAAQSSDDDDDSGLTMGVLATPNSLDPHAANDPSSNHVTVNIYEKLVRFTPDSELEPELSESFEQIEDTTWEFILREDVTFHDAGPLS